MFLLHSKQWKELFIDTNDCYFYKKKEKKRWYWIFNRFVIEIILIFVSFQVMEEGVSFVSNN
jgi:hypothetical protein